MGLSLRQGLIGASVALLLAVPHPRAEGIPWVDGYAFLGGGYEFPDPVSHFKGNRLGALAAWSPVFLGMETRLAAGAHHSTSYREPGDDGIWNDREWEVGLEEIWLRVPFDLFSWSFFAQGGSFRWCGNPDAVLSGGFLARSGTGSWMDLRPGLEMDALDSVSALVPGLRFGIQSPGRAWSHEAMILVDTLWERTDYTPVYSFTFSPSDGFQLGGTVEYYRGIFGDGPRTYHYSWPDGIDTVTVDPRVLSFSARMAVDMRAWLRGEAAPDRAGKVYLEGAWHGKKEAPIYLAERRKLIHLMAGLHLPGFGFLQDFRLQFERSPLRLQHYPRYPLSNPYYGSSYSDYYWYGQAYAAKDFLSWLSLQGWLVMSLGTEGDHSPDGGANSYVNNGVFMGEGRLVARF